MIVLCLGFPCNVTGIIESVQIIIMIQFSYFFDLSTVHRFSFIILKAILYIIPDILDPVLQPDPTFSILYTLLILSINNV